MQNNQKPWNPQSQYSQDAQLEEESNNAEAELDVEMEEPDSLTP